MALATPGNRARAGYNASPDGDVPEAGDGLSSPPRLVPTACSRWITWIARKRFLPRSTVQEPAAPEMLSPDSG